MPSSNPTSRCVAIEHELKFLASDPPSIIARLLDLGGGQLRSRHLLRRWTFDPPGSPRGTFVRVRDEGGEQAKLTYKSVEGEQVHEVEVTIDQVEPACTLLTCLGLAESSYEENYRETYHLHQALVTLDTWPGLAPFLEIEAPSMEEVHETAVLLGLDPKQGIGGTVDDVYKVAGIDLSRYRVVTFQTEFFAAPGDEEALQSALR